jgi:KaiC/GvpD/RAD55 family RecA-like ATPase
MIKDGIRGLDRIFEGEIPEGSVILITGREGTLKSGLVFSLLSSCLSLMDSHGLYVSLEQTKESHLKNMKSLGLEKSAGLHIFDYSDMRSEWEGEDLDIANTMDEVINIYKEKHGSISVFALDSLNALYAISPETNLRKSMYYLLSELRSETASFLIMETPFDGARFSGQGNGPEHFLADGVIELGVVEAAEGVKRYIQVRKMRACRHRMEKHQLVVEKNGLRVLGPIY